MRKGLPGEKNESYAHRRNSGNIGERGNYKKVSSTSEKRAHKDLKRKSRFASPRGTQKGLELSPREGKKGKETHHQEGEWTFTSTRSYGSPASVGNTDLGEVASLIAARGEKEMVRAEKKGKDIKSLKWLRGREETLKGRQGLFPGFKERQRGEEGNSETLEMVHARGKEGLTKIFGRPSQLA